MADDAKIGMTAMFDREGRRVRYYRKKQINRPGQQERRRMMALGLRWCRGCRDWLPEVRVRQGSCQSCSNAEDRQRYAECPKFQAARKAHGYQRRRGAEPVPSEARELLTELFDGQCAYCVSPATTWDHVIAITLGGATVPGNILPACGSCNSRKHNHDIHRWLDRAPTIKPFTVEYLALAGVL